MENSSFSEKFDAYYNARKSYSIYRNEDTYYDPTQDLPPGIHADINRVEISLIDDDEDDDGFNLNDEDDFQPNFKEI